MITVAVVSIYLLIAYHQCRGDALRSAAASVGCVVLVGLVAPVPVALDTGVLVGLVAFVVLQLAMPLADSRPTAWALYVGRLRLGMAVQ